jgi:hypothetical protein
MLKSGAWAPNRFLKMASRTKTVLEINHVLNDAERDTLIHSIDERSWMAVLQIVLAGIEVESQIVSDPKSSQNFGTIANSAGRLSALRDLVATLEISRQTGGRVQKVEDDEES